MTHDNISQLENKYGRCIYDSQSGGEIIIEYNRDGDYHCICDCGNRAPYNYESGTYKCGCGWESTCVNDNPDKFIDVNDITIEDINTQDKQYIECKKIEHEEDQNYFNNLCDENKD